MYNVAVEKKSSHRDVRRSSSNGALNYRGWEVTGQKKEQGMKSLTPEREWGQIFCVTGEIKKVG